MAAHLLRFFFFIIIFWFCTLPQPSLQTLPTDFPSVIYHQCTLATTSSPNLDTALQNFSTIASEGIKYSVATLGISGTNPVYAVFQCRGDLTADSCHVCVRSAVDHLYNYCLNSLRARVQMDGCFLRYENRSFFSLDLNETYRNCGSQLTNNVTALTATQEVMEGIRSLAPKQGGFAVVVNHGVFGVAECIGYINSSECSQCLNYNANCGSPMGMQIYLGSCYYRFEFSNFLETLPSPPSGPAPAAPPAPPPRSAPPTSAAAPAGGSGTWLAFCVWLYISIGIHHHVIE